MFIADGNEYGFSSVGATLFGAADNHKHPIPTGFTAAMEGERVNESS
jgi:hypothetical protein